MLKVSQLPTSISLCKYEEIGSKNSLARAIVTFKNMGSWYCDVFGDL